MNVHQYAAPAAGSLCGVCDVGLFDMSTQLTLCSMYVALGLVTTDSVTGTHSHLSSDWA